MIDDVQTQCDAHDDIVDHEPKAVVETNVVRMAVRHALPDVLPLPQRSVLEGPIAKLLQSNVHLLRRREYVFERRMFRSQAPFQHQQDALGHDAMTQQARDETSSQHRIQPDRGKVPEAGDDVVAQRRGRLDHALGHAQTPLRTRSDQAHVRLEKGAHLEGAVDLV